jgi:hypothetical protein
VASDLDDVFARVRMGGLKVGYDDFVKQITVLSHASSDYGVSVPKLAISRQRPKKLIGNPPDFRARHPYDAEARLTQRRGDGCNRVLNRNNLVQPFLHECLCP